MDGSGFKIEVPQVEHDLTTPRGRLLYLRDVVVPGIPPDKIDMNLFCGTVCCLYGWAAKDPALGLKPFGECSLVGGDRPREIGMDRFDVSLLAWSHMTHSSAYGRSDPTHAELTAHINDVLEGRVT